MVKEVERNQKNYNKSISLLSFIFVMSLVGIFFTLDFEKPIYFNPLECNESQIIFTISSENDSKADLWNRGLGKQSVCYTDIFGESYNANKKTILNLSDSEKANPSIELIQGWNSFGIKTKSLTKNELKQICNISPEKDVQIYLVDSTGNTLQENLVEGKVYEMFLEQNCTLNSNSSERSNLHEVIIDKEKVFFSVGVETPLSKLRLKKQTLCEIDKIEKKQRNLEQDTNPSTPDEWKIETITEESLTPGKAYILTCNSTGNFKPIGQSIDNHECNSRNTLFYLTNSHNSTASLKEDTTYSYPICFGQLFCKNVSSETECRRLGGKTIVGLSSETNANLSLYNLKNYSITICCSNSELACTPNWTEIVSEYKNNDTLVVMYNDTRGCGTESNKPQNKKIRKDLNNDSFVGNLSEFKEKNRKLKIVINNSELNESIRYLEFRKIEIKENESKVLDFEFNFSDSSKNISLVDIEIKKQENNSAFGFLVVRGIKQNKTLYLDRVNRSGILCLKDGDISDVSEISTSCTRSNEIKLNCPGNTSKYSCTVSDNKYVISGLENSGVRELSPAEGSNVVSNTIITTCTSNWTCSDWSECISNLRTRACTDKNRCTSPTNRPEEIENCISEFQSSLCESNWTCQSWSICKDKEQSRTCMDLHSCIVPSSKQEKRACTEETSESTTTYLAILITLISLAILTLVGIIFLFIKRAQSKSFINRKNQYSLS